MAWFLTAAEILSQPRIGHFAKSIRLDFAFAAC